MIRHSTDGLLELRWTLAFLILAGALNAQPAERGIAFEREAYFPEGSDMDFGSIEDKEGHADTLWLVNPGVSPLIIQNVRTSCGCTVASWPEGAVPAAARVAIPLQFRCLRSGYVEKEIEVWVKGRKKPLRAMVMAECAAGE